LCHYGSSFSPPPLKPGETTQGSDGQTWAYTGPSKDHRCAVFKVHEPLESNASRLAPARITATRKIDLALLPVAVDEPPEHLPDGLILTYGNRQFITHNRKNFYPSHVDSNGEILSGKGEEPWPLYRQQDALDYAKQRWVVETEGEKCCDWVRVGGLVCVSQPGFDRSSVEIRRRYGELKAAGITGIVSIADNDQSGEKLAEKCARAAAEVELPFRWIRATDLWVEIPVGGSIDDATGTAKDRLAALQAAIDHGKKLRSLEPLEDAEKSAIEKLEAFAIDVLSKPLQHRTHLLRARAKELGINLTGREVDSYLRLARSKRDNRGAIRFGSRKLDSTPTPWIWEDLLIGGSINVLGALPKVGKTSLLVSAIAAWHHGARSYCGKQFVGPCPPVIIIGTDQPQRDWARMLEAAHLYGGSDADGLSTPVREIWTMEDGLILDEEGFELLEGVAKDYPKALFITDSVAATVSGPLGIAEESPDIAEPLRLLQARVGLYGGTTVFVAHAGKGRSGDDPICALRGSTALPAVASQVLGLSRMTDAPGDDRLLLQTKGRGGSPQKLLLVRDEQGNFVCHGDAAEVLLAQHLQEAEEKLTEEQSELLLLIRSRAEQGHETSSNDALIQAQEDPENRTAKDRARRRLQAIEKRGLITSRKESNGQAQITLWSPVIASTKGALESTSQPSKPSQPLVIKSFDAFDAFDGGEGVAHVNGDKSEARDELGDGSTDFEAAVIKAALKLKGDGKAVTSVGVLNEFSTIAERDLADPVCDAYLGHFIQGTAAINKVLKTNKQLLNGEISNA